MKALAFLTILPIVACASMGCTAVTASLDKLTDDELASHVEGIAKSAAQLAIQFATWKDPSKATQIKADATVADQVARLALIPMFQNAPLGTVLVGGITIAQQQLSSKLVGSPVDTLVLVAQTALAAIPVPSSGYLSPRLQKAIAGGFLGLAEGIETAMNIPSPVPVPVAPPPPPTATPPQK